MIKGRKWSRILFREILYVPVEEASLKEEYCARTLRPKIVAKISHFLTKLVKKEPLKISLDLKLDSLDLNDIDKIISTLKIDNSVSKIEYFHGGESETNKSLEILRQVALLR